MESRTFQHWNSGLWLMWHCPEKPRTHFATPQKTYKYTKGMVQQFTELLWEENIDNLLMTEGWSEIPRVSCSPLPIHLGVSREVDVLVMSLMYKNNLLNSFLFRVDRAVASPICICGSDHIITLCNSSRSMVDLAAEQCSTILNCSRDYMFVNLCKWIMESQGPNLRRKIHLSKR